MLHQDRYGYDNSKLVELMHENAKLKENAARIVVSELNGLLSGDAKTILQLWWDNKQLQVKKVKKDA